MKQSQASTGDLRLSQGKWIFLGIHVDSNFEASQIALTNTDGTVFSFILSRGAYSS